MKPSAARWPIAASPIRPTLRSYSTAVRPGTNELGDNEAACGPNDLSGNPSRFLRCQEHCQGHNIGGATKPAERCLPSRDIAGATFKRPGRNIALRFCMADCNGIDSDPAS